MMPDSIPIFLASDENYAPLVAVTMLSILKNTQSFVDFYVLDSGISNDSKRKIAFSCKQFNNYSTKYLNISTDEHFGKFPDRYYYSLSAYNRYLIPQLEPDLKKAIYSDVDVVFCGDIREFYDLDMENYPIAATIEEFGDDLRGEWSHIDRKKTFGIDDSHTYFQSGNLLIDCEYWREHGVIEKLMMATQQYSNALVAPDLDVFNIVFANNCKILDYKYSVCANLMNVGNKPKEIVNAEQNPYLVHFAGQYKPWNSEGVFYSERFWEHARETAFYERLLFTMHKALLAQAAKNTLWRKGRYWILSHALWGKKKTYYREKFKKCMK